MSRNLARVTLIGALAFVAGCHDERSIQCTPYGGGPDHQGVNRPGTGHLSIINTQKTKSVPQHTYLTVEMKGGSNGTFNRYIRLPVALGPIGGDSDAFYVTKAKFEGGWNECHATGVNDYLRTGDDPPWLWYE